MEIFDTLVAQFNSQIAVWEPISIGLARNLFYSLALIQLIWVGMLWMMNRNDPSDSIMEFVKRIIVISFWWMVIDQSGTWVPAILNSFRQAGEQMSGVGALSPSEIIRKGIQITSALMDASISGGVLQNLAGALFGVIVSLIVFLAFLAVGLELVLVLIGGKIVLVGGLIVLGFAASQWTSDFAQKYFVTCIHVGMKILFITLIVGLAENITDTWIDLIKKGIAEKHLFETYFSILAGSLLYMVLVMRIPDMASSMLTGTFGMGFGSAPMVLSTAVGGFIWGTKMAAPTAGAGSAILEAGKAGVLKASSSDAGFLGKVWAGVSTSVGTLMKTTFSHIKEGLSNSVSKTTTGKIANHIKTLNAAQREKMPKKIR